MEAEDVLSSSSPAAPSRSPASLSPTPSVSSSPPAASRAASSSSLQSSARGAAASTLHHYPFSCPRAMGLPDFGACVPRTSSSSLLHAWIAQAGGVSAISRDLSRSASAVGGHINGLDIEEVIFCLLNALEASSSEAASNDPLNVFAGLPFPPLPYAAPSEGVENASADRAASGDRELGGAGGPAHPPEEQRLRDARDRDLALAAPAARSHSSTWRRVPSPEAMSLLELQSEAAVAETLCVFAEKHMALLMLSIRSFLEVRVTVQAHQLALFRLLLRVLGFWIFQLEADGRGDFPGSAPALVDVSDSGDAGRAEQAVQAERLDAVTTREGREKKEDVEPWEEDWLNFALREYPLLKPLDGRKLCLSAAMSMIAAVHPTTVLHKLSKELRQARKSAAYPKVSELLGLFCQLVPLLPSRLALSPPSRGILVSLPSLACGSFSTSQQPRPPPGASSGSSAALSRHSSLGSSRASSQRSLASAPPAAPVSASAPPPPPPLPPLPVRLNLRLAVCSALSSVSACLALTYEQRLLAVSLVGAAGATRQALAALRALSSSPAGARLPCLFEVRRRRAQTRAAPRACGALRREAETGGRPYGELESGHGAAQTRATPFSASRFADEAPAKDRAPPYVFLRHLVKPEGALTEDRETPGAQADSSRGSAEDPKAEGTESESGRNTARAGELSVAGGHPRGGADKAIAAAVEVWNSLQETLLPYLLLLPDEEEGGGEVSEELHPPPASLAAVQQALSAALHLVHVVAGEHLSAAAISPAPPSPPPASPSSPSPSPPRPSIPRFGRQMETLLQLLLLHLLCAARGRSLVRAVRTQARLAREREKERREEGRKKEAKAGRAAKPAEERAGAEAPGEASDPVGAETEEGLGGERQGVGATERRRKGGKKSAAEADGKATLDYVKFGQLVEKALDEEIRVYAQVIEGEGAEVEDAEPSAPPLPDPRDVQLLLMLLLRCMALDSDCRSATRFAHLRALGADAAQKPADEGAETTLAEAADGRHQNDKTTSEACSWNSQPFARLLQRQIFRIVATSTAVMSAFHWDSVSQSSPSPSSAPLSPALRSSSSPALSSSTSRPCAVSSWFPSAPPSFFSRGASLLSLAPLALSAGEPLLLACLLNPLASSPPADPSAALAAEYSNASLWALLTSRAHHAHAPPVPLLGSPSSRPSREGLPSSLSSLSPCSSSDKTSPCTSSSPSSPASAPSSPAPTTTVSSVFSPPLSPRSQGASDASAPEGDTGGEDAEGGGENGGADDGRPSDFDGAACRAAADRGEIAVALARAVCFLARFQPTAAPLFAALLDLLRRAVKSRGGAQSKSEAQGERDSAPRVALLCMLTHFVAVLPLRPSSSSLRVRHLKLSLDDSTPSLLGRRQMAAASRKRESLVLASAVSRGAAPGSSPFPPPSHLSSAPPSSASHTLASSFRELSACSPPRGRLPLQESERRARAAGLGSAGGGSTVPRWRSFAARLEPVFLQQQQAVLSEGLLLVRELCCVLAVYTLQREAVRCYSLAFSLLQLLRQLARNHYFSHFQLLDVFLEPSPIQPTQSRETLLASAFSLLLIFGRVGEEALGERSSLPNFHEAHGNGDEEDPNLFATDGGKGADTGAQASRPQATAEARRALLRRKQEDFSGAFAQHVSVMRPPWDAILALDEEDSSMPPSDQSDLGDTDDEEGEALCEATARIAAAAEADAGQGSGQAVEETHEKASRGRANGEGGFLAGARSILFRGTALASEETPLEGRADAPASETRGSGGEPQASAAEGAEGRAAPGGDGAYTIGGFFFGAGGAAAETQTALVLPTIAVTSPPRDLSPKKARGAGAREAPRAPSALSPLAATAGGENLPAASAASDAQAPLSDGLPPSAARGGSPSAALLALADPPLPSSCSLAVPARERSHANEEGFASLACVRRTWCGAPPVELSCLLLFGLRLLALRPGGDAGPGLGETDDEAEAGEPHAPPAPRVSDAEEERNEERQARRERRLRQAAARLIQKDLCRRVPGLLFPLLLDALQQPRLDRALPAVLLSLAALARSHAPKLSRSSSRLAAGSYSRESSLRNGTSLAALPPAQSAASDDAPERLPSRAQLQRRVSPGLAASTSAGCLALLSDAVFLRRQTDTLAWLLFYAGADPRRMPGLARCALEALKALRVFLFLPPKAPWPSASCFTSCAASPSPFSSPGAGCQGGQPAACPPLALNRGELLAPVPACGSGAHADHDLDGLLCALDEEREKPKNPDAPAEHEADASAGNAPLPPAAGGGASPLAALRSAPAFCCLNWTAELASQLLLQLCICGRALDEFSRAAAPADSPSRLPGGVPSLREFFLLHCLRSLFTVAAALRDLASLHADRAGESVSGGAGAQGASSTGAGRGEEAEGEGEPTPSFVALLPRAIARYDILLLHLAAVCARELASSSVRAAFLRALLGRAVGSGVLPEFAAPVGGGGRADGGDSQPAEGEGAGADAGGGAAWSAPPTWARLLDDKKARQDAVSRYGSCRLGEAVRSGLMKQGALTDGLLLLTRAVPALSQALRSLPLLGAPVRRNHHAPAAHDAAGLGGGGLGGAPPRTPSSAYAQQDRNLASLLLSPAPSPYAAALGASKGGGKEDAAGKRALALTRPLRPSASKRLWKRFLLAASGSAADDRLALLTQDAAGATFCWLASSAGATWLQTHLALPTASSLAAMFAADSRAAATRVVAGPFGGPAPRGDVGGGSAVSSPRSCISAGSSASPATSPRKDARLRRSPPLPRAPQEAGAAAAPQLTSQQSSLSAKSNGLRRNSSQSMKRELAESPASPRALPAHVLLPLASETSIVALRGVADASGVGAEEVERDDDASCPVFPVTGDTALYLVVARALAIVASSASAFSFVVRFLERVEEEGGKQRPMLMSSLAFFGKSAAQVKAEKLKNLLTVCRGVCAANAPASCFSLSLLFCTARDGHQLLLAQEQKKAREEAKRAVLARDALAESIPPKTTPSARDAQGGFASAWQGFAAIWGGGNAPVSKVEEAEVAEAQTEASACADGAPQQKGEAPSPSSPKEKAGGEEDEAPEESEQALPQAVREAKAAEAAMRKQSGKGAQQNGPRGGRGRGRDMREGSLTHRVHQLFADRGGDATYFSLKKEGDAFFFSRTASNIFKSPHSSALLPMFTGLKQETEIDLAEAVQELKEEVTALLTAIARTEEDDGAEDVLPGGVWKTVGRDPEGGEAGALELEASADTPAVDAERFPSRALAVSDAEKQGARNGEQANRGRQGCRVRVLRIQEKRRLANSRASFLSLLRLLLPLHRSLSASEELEVALAFVAVRAAAGARGFTDFSVFRHDDDGRVVEDGGSLTFRSASSSASPLPRGYHREDASAAAFGASPAKGKEGLGWGVFLLPATFSLVEASEDDGFDADAVTESAGGRWRADREATPSADLAETLDAVRTAEAAAREASGTKRPEGEGGEAAEGPERAASTNDGAGALAGAGSSAALAHVFSSGDRLLPSVDQILRRAPLMDAYTRFAELTILALLAFVAEPTTGALPPPPLRLRAGEVKAAGSAWCVRRHQTPAANDPLLPLATLLRQRGYAIVRLPLDASGICKPLRAALLPALRCIAALLVCGLPLGSPSSASFAVLDEEEGARGGAAERRRGGHEESSESHALFPCDGAVASLVLLHVLHLLKGLVPRVVSSALGQLKLRRPAAFCCVRPRAPSSRLFASPAASAFALHASSRASSPAAAGSPRGPLEVAAAESAADPPSIASRMLAIARAEPDARGGHRSRYAASAAWGFDGAVASSAQPSREQGGRQAALGIGDRYTMPLEPGDRGEAFYSSPFRGLAGCGDGGMQVTSVWAAGPASPPLLCAFDLPESRDFGAAGASSLTQETSAMAEDTLSLKKLAQQAGETHARIDRAVNKVVLGVYVQKKEWRTVAVLFKSIRFRLAGLPNPFLRWKALRLFYQLALRCSSFSLPPHFASRLFGAAQHAASGFASSLVHDGICALCNKSSRGHFSSSPSFGCSSPLSFSSSASSSSSSSTLALGSGALPPSGAWLHCLLLVLPHLGDAVAENGALAFSVLRELLLRCADTAHLLQLLELPDAYFAPGGLSPHKRAALSDFSEGEELASDRSEPISAARLPSPGGAREKRPERAAPAPCGRGVDAASQDVAQTDTESAVSSSSSSRASPNLRMGTSRATESSLLRACWGGEEDAEAERAAQEARSAAACGDLLYLLLSSIVHADWHLSRGMLSFFLLPLAEDDVGTAALVAMRFCLFLLLQQRISLASSQASSSSSRLPSLTEACLPSSALPSHPPTARFDRADSAVWGSSTSPQARGPPARGEANARGEGESAEAAGGDAGEDSPQPADAAGVGVGGAPSVAESSASRKRSMSSSSLCPRRDEALPAGGREAPTTGLRAQLQPQTDHEIVSCFFFSPVPLADVPPAKERRGDRQARLFAAAVLGILNRRRERLCLEAERYFRDLRQKQAASPDSASSSSTSSPAGASPRRSPTISAQRPPLPDVRAVDASLPRTAFRAPRDGGPTRAPSVLSASTAAPPFASLCFSSALPPSHAASLACLPPLFFPFTEPGAAQACSESLLSAALASAVGGVALCRFGQGGHAAAYAETLSTEPLVQLTALRCVRELASASGTSLFSVLAVLVENSFALTEQKPSELGGLLAEGLRGEAGAETEPLRAAKPEGAARLGSAAPARLGSAAPASGARDEAEAKKLQKVASSPPGACCLASLFDYETKAAAAPATRMATCVKGCVHSILVGLFAEDRALVKRLLRAFTDILNNAPCTISFPASCILSPSADTLRELRRRPRGARSSPGTGDALRRRMREEREDGLRERLRFLNPSTHQVTLLLLLLVSVRSQLPSASALNLPRATRTKLQENRMARSATQTTSREATSLPAPASPPLPPSPAEVSLSLSFPFASGEGAALMTRAVARHLPQLFATALIRLGACYELSASPRLPPAAPGAPRELHVSLAALFAPEEEEAARDEPVDGAAAAAPDAPSSVAEPGEADEEDKEDDDAEADDDAEGDDEAEGDEGQSIRLYASPRSGSFDAFSLSPPLFTGNDRALPPRAQTAARATPGSGDEASLSDAERRRHGRREADRPEAAERCGAARSGRRERGDRRDEGRSGVIAVSIIARQEAVDVAVMLIRALAETAKETELLVLLNKARVFERLKEEDAYLGAVKDAMTIFLCVRPCAASAVLSFVVPFCERSAKTQVLVACELISAVSSFLLFSSPRASQAFASGVATASADGALLAMPSALSAGGLPLLGAEACGLDCASPRSACATLSAAPRPPSAPVAAALLSQLTEAVLHALDRTSYLPALVADSLRRAAVNATREKSASSPAASAAFSAPAHPWFFFGRSSHAVAETEAESEEERRERALQWSHILQKKILMNIATWHGEEGDLLRDQKRVEEADLPPQGSVLHALATLFLALTALTGLWAASVAERRRERDGTPRDADRDEVEAERQGQEGGTKAGHMFGSEATALEILETLETGLCLAPFLSLGLGAAAPDAPASGADLETLDVTRAVQLVAKVCLACVSACAALCQVSPSYWPSPRCAERLLCVLNRSLLLRPHVLTPLLLHSTSSRLRCATLGLLSTVLLYGQQFSPPLSLRWSASSSSTISSSSSPSPSAASPPASPAFVSPPRGHESAASSAFSASAEGAAAQKAREGAPWTGEGSAEALEPDALDELLVCVTVHLVSEDSGTVAAAATLLDKALFPLLLAGCKDEAGAEAEADVSRAREMLTACLARLGFSPAVCAQAEPEAAGRLPPARGDGGATEDAFGEARACAAEKGGDARGVLSAALPQRRVHAVAPLLRAHAVQRLLLELLPLLLRSEGRSRLSSAAAASPRRVSRLSSTSSSHSKSTSATRSPTAVSAEEPSSHETRASRRGSATGRDGRRQPSRLSSRGPEFRLLGTSVEVGFAPGSPSSGAKTRRRKGDAPADKAGDAALSTAAGAPSAFTLHASPRWLTRLFALLLKARAYFPPEAWAVRVEPEAHLLDAQRRRREKLVRRRLEMVLYGHPDAALAASKAAAHVLAAKKRGEYFFESQKLPAGLSSVFGGGPEDTTEGLEASAGNLLKNFTSYFRIGGDATAARRAALQAAGARLAAKGNARALRGDAAAAAGCEDLAEEGGREDEEDKAADEDDVGESETDVAEDASSEDDDDLPVSAELRRWRFMEDYLREEGLPTSRLLLGVSPVTVTDFLLSEDPLTTLASRTSGGSSSSVSAPVGAVCVEETAGAGAAGAGERAPQGEAEEARTPWGRAGGRPIHVAASLRATQGEESPAAVAYQAEVFLGGSACALALVRAIAAVLESVPEATRLRVKDLLRLEALAVAATRQICALLPAPAARSPLTEGGLRTQSSAVGGAVDETEETSSLQFQKAAAISLGALALLQPSLHSEDA